MDTEPELLLIKQILSFSEIIEDTAHDFQLQRLARFAYELARSFTHFYETTLVFSEDIPKNLQYARLALVAVARDTLARACDLMGISAPDKM